MAKSNRLLTARLLGYGLFGGGYDVGVMYGLMGKNNFGMMAASAGVSYVQYTAFNLFEDEKSHGTVGLPLQLQAFLTPF